jgi:hypothetical protein
MKGFSVRNIFSGGGGKGEVFHATLHIGPEE